MENQTSTDSGTAPAVVSSDLLGASELSNIKQVERWTTSDGEEHPSLESAQWHARQMDAANRANAVLNAGGSVADAMRASGWDSTIDPILERVTKRTKLVISYWQCRDTPGYQVQNFRHDRRVFVWGNAGSWSGAYGGKVSFPDLARYAAHEATLFA